MSEQRNAVTDAELGLGGPSGGASCKQTRERESTPTCANVPLGPFGPLGPLGLSILLPSIF